ncbi:S-layer homology domain-containing protein [Paenibacillus athensensis]|uniref:SLH domain-containing protein n=1 Tax=Paenibacillus athensensis TaxID=1967502 RepID=A0A4Y8PR13_9BACL|nr:S-layer homology domain-containing protein [Paenibacillus athensensis]MCD1261192.1 S-layer homology domain-containing protein [Paenibacillus athensensis]
MNNSHFLLTKRSLRRAVSMLLAVCMMFALLPLAQARPASALKVEVNGASGHAGETVSVSVYMTPGHESMVDDSFWKYTMKLNYDSNVLTLAGTPTDNANAAHFDTSESVTGSVYVTADTFDSGVFIDHGQKLMTLQFTIKPNAPAGDTDITLAGGSYTIDTDPTEMLATSLVSGKVTVLSAPKSASVSIAAREGRPGSKVTVPVTLTDATAGVGSYGMRIKFDPAVLQVDSISGSTGSMFDSTYNNTDGYLQVAWADLSGGDSLIQKGQEMFKVTFSLAPKAQDGIVPLTVEDTTNIQQFTLTDVEAVEMVKTLQAGRVIIKTPKASAPSNVEKITVPVKNRDGNSADAVSKAEIERTSKPDGTKSDKVVLTSDQTKQAVDLILASKSKSADIVIPDTQDEVSEVNVSVPKDSTKLIKDAQIDIGIVTDNVKVSIPNDSLQNFDEDLYFHFVPIKTDSEKQQVKVRADQEQIVQKASGGQGVTVVGRPMTIETNLQSRKVDLTMPLKDVQLSQEELANLAVFVEHSDGTKELLHGKLVDYGDGGQGLQFSVNKFSTFTLVHMEPVTQTHSAYVNGYEDGTFRPERAITRAEMATILTRVVEQESTATDIAYSDVPAGHWAAAAISKATTMKLMSGYPDGTFGPDRPITRAEMASLVSLLATANSDGAGFSDIAGHWAQAAILKAQGAGLIEGYPDGSFQPEQAITRAEAVAIINKTLGRKPSGGAVTAPWKDVDASNWAYDDIVEASVAHSFTVQADGSEKWVDGP